MFTDVTLVCKDEKPEELDVAETEELAENDQGEPGEVVKMRDESKTERD